MCLSQMMSVKPNDENIFIIIIAMLYMLHFKYLKKTIMAFVFIWQFVLYLKFYFIIFLAYELSSGVTRQSVVK